MIKNINHLKHWMLFIPLILPTLLQYGVQFAFMGKMQRWQLDMMEDPEGTMSVMPDLTAYTPYVLFFILLSALAASVGLLWYWSVGSGLRDFLPNGTGLKLSRFKVTLIAQGALYFFFLAAIYYSFSFFAEFLPQLTDGGDPATAFGGDPDAVLRTFLSFFGLFFLASLLLFACAIYNAYFVGKTLKSIEMGRPSRGSETVGYLILSILLFIGVWLLQPKINRLVETGTMAKPGDDSVWGEGS